MDEWILSRQDIGTLPGFKVVPMPSSPLEKARQLQALHRSGKCFVIPNPWDAGSARLLAAAGFDALATTSAGVGFSLGRSNGQAGRDAILQNARDIAAAVDLPVSVDLENGYGDAPRTVAETIRLTIEGGFAGGSIEDATGLRDNPIYEIGLAVERMAAASEAARRADYPFQLVGRAENFLFGRPDLADTIRRLQAYQEAGADVLYAPGLTTLQQIRAVVAEIDRPLNVVMGLSGSDLTVDQLAAAGVARISVGSALARAAYGGLIRASRRMLDAGSFDFAKSATPFGEIDAMFA